MSGLKGDKPTCKVCGRLGYTSFLEDNDPVATIVTLLETKKLKGSQNYRFNANGSNWIFFIYKQRETVLINITTRSAARLHDQNDITWHKNFLDRDIYGEGMVGVTYTDEYDEYKERFERALGFSF